MDTDTMRGCSPTFSDGDDEKLGGGNWSNCDTLYSQFTKRRQNVVLVVLIVTVNNEAYYYDCQVVSA